MAELQAPKKTQLYCGYIPRATWQCFMLVVSTVYVDICLEKIELFEFACLPRVICGSCVLVMWSVDVFCEWYL